MEQADQQADPSKDTRIYFRVDDELNERLRIHAVRAKKNLQEVCVDAIEEYLRGKSA